MNHKWGPEDRHHNQECLNGCGCLRTMLTGSGMNSTVPVPHYKSPHSKQWLTYRPDCNPPRAWAMKGTSSIHD